MKAAILLLILHFALGAFHAAGQVKTPTSVEQKTKTAMSDEAREAFRGFDFGSLRINPNNLTNRDIADLRADFLPAVKPLIVEKGDDVRRLARIAAPIFLFHKTNKSQTIVFEGETPAVFTWKETFVTFSTGAMDVLSDDEIAALVAHEIGHLYYAEALARARADGDDRLTRVIELRCDLAALVTLTKLQIKPQKLISAVKKMIEERKRLGVESVQAGSPAVADREAMLEAYSDGIKSQSKDKR